jgi:FAD/FMN-containing dehydrogenase
MSYDKEKGTVDIGAGCLFNEVYHYLQPLGRNIVGGAATSNIGVAGWLLGGGYSLKTSQYGLGIDNLTEVEIVLPAGGKDSVKTITANDDLFWAVKVCHAMFCEISTFS